MTFQIAYELEIVPHRFAERIASHHVVKNDKHVVGIDTRLPEKQWRCQELQAHGAWIRGMRRKRKTQLKRDDITSIDPQSVKDIERVVARMEPEWIEDVREACGFTNLADEIVDRTDLDYDTVAAIIAILIADGELPKRG